MPFTQLQCSQCNRIWTPKKEARRLPTGWKNAWNEYWCGECWAKKHYLRAISISVASPLSCSWDDLRKTLRQLFSQVTAASNWMMTELYAHDARRQGEADEKIPPMKHRYLYPEARARFPQLPPQTVASLEQSVTRKYRASRFAVIWKCSQSLPAFRYPVPLPIHTQSWSAFIMEDRPVVRIRLKDQWIELRLRGGHQFRRQLKAYGLMACGDALRGELALYEQGTAVMVKMVAWLPRPVPGKREEGSILFVRTGKQFLLTAVNVKDEVLWKYNGDHIRRRIREHATLVQRLAEDQKAGMRPVPPFAERRSAAVVKFGDRMDTALHQVARELANYASTRKFSAVRYDDSEQGFMKGRYFQLRRLIAEKLDELGIVMDVTTR